MDGPILARRDRVFHQGVTRLEVLRPSGLLRLPLHFLYLPTLGVGLGTRINQRDGGENRARHSGQSSCVNIHDSESMMNESGLRKRRKLRFARRRLHELDRGAVGITHINDTLAGVRAGLESLRFSRCLPAGGGDGVPGRRPDYRPQTRRGPTRHRRDADERVADRAAPDTRAIRSCGHSL